MTPRLVVRPEAEADIDEAYAWYEDRVTGLGDQFLDAVGESIGHVREAPQRFPIVLRDADLIIRRALVDRFPFGVFFIWGEETGDTSVIACMHARRDPRSWRRRARP